MNDKLLTGVRKNLFLIIAKFPGISLAELCSFSWARGGEMVRINHHLMGLESEGFIQVLERGKRGDYKFAIKKGKGARMHRYLLKVGGLEDPEEIEISTEGK